MHHPRRALKRRPTRVIAFLLALLACSLSSLAQGREIVHVVREGQNLGMIARRYHTTVDAIAKNNRLKPRTMLRPGQTLRVVEVAEQRRWREFLEQLEARKKGRKAPEKKADTPKAPEKKADTLKAAPAPAKTAPAATPERPRASKARRQARTQVAPAVAARGKAGEDDKGDRAAKEPRRDRRASGRRGAKQLDGPPRKAAEPSSSPTPAVAEAGAATPPADEWARAPKRPGHVSLVRYSERFRGELVDGKRHVVSKAAKKIDHLLRSLRKREETEIDRRLLERLADLSDHFGGRTIVVVSGYRPFSPKQYTKNSRHNHGRAIDFRVVGVPVQAVFDHCRTLRETGCGYYPNSEFVHMDVRDVGADWTDYSLPGQPPRYAKKQRAGESKEVDAKAADESGDSAEVDEAPTKSR